MPPALCSDLMKILSLFIFIIMSLAGVLQTFIYTRTKEVFEHLPVVAGEITHSRLLNQMGLNNEQLLEAIIYYKYTFRGQEYEANTPALRGYDLFPSLEYERSLVNKYKTGDIVNIRVMPEIPDLAYLEVAPLSKSSAILAPVMTLGGIALLLAYFYGIFDILYKYILI
jgi:hypothetical protein